VDTTNNNFKVFGLAPMQGRWLYVPLGILSLLCLGTVYSWSIFRKPLETALKVAPQESLLPFGTLLAVFAIVMPIVGRYIEKYGPQRVAAVGGLVMGLGYCLSGLATNIPVLVVTYGIIAGAGVGITMASRSPWQQNGFPIGRVWRWG
jgi:MFS transporter, OFA family, oxalate/formate antiporter